MNTNKSPSQEYNRIEIARVPNDTRRAALIGHRIGIGPKILRRRHKTNRTEGKLTIRYIY